MKNKLIYSDVDECVVKWFPEFSRRGISMGYKVIDPTAYYIHHHFDMTNEMAEEMVETFHHEGMLRNLEPIDDSVYYLKKLCEDFDYKIVFITACGDYNQYSIAWNDRYENLSDIVGSENIHELICVNGSANKRQHLLDYNDAGALWVDDSIKNVEMGASLGYESYIYDSPFNKHYEGVLPRVKSWRHIYDIIKERG